MSSGMKGSPLLFSLTSLVMPDLTVVDAVRILTAHGPTGGDLADVKQMDTVIASRDIVTADAYATTLFGLQGLISDTSRQAQTWVWGQWT